MGIHVPQTLLDVSEEITVRVKLSRITDRQIKNIVRSVKSGYIPLYANSATAHIARHIAVKFHVPHLKWSNWRFNMSKVPSDHPIWDKVTEAAAVSKLEFTPQQYDWHGNDIDRYLKEAIDKNSQYISYYHFSESGQKVLKDVGKGWAIPNSHPVHEYLDKLTNREVEFIELETDKCAKTY